MTTRSQRTGNLSYVLAKRPAEFGYWSEQFVAACIHALEFDYVLTKRALQEFNGLAVTHWFHFVAQNAGADRVALWRQGGHSPEAMEARAQATLQIPRMPSPKAISDVFDRDKYRCRYCRVPVVPKSVMKLLSAKSGIELGKMKTNLQTHGAHWIHCATIDHVHPHALGGLNTPENIVTSCNACQYGKGKYTLSDLRLELRPPTRDLHVMKRSWVETIHGLISLSQ